MSPARQGKKRRKKGDQEQPQKVYPNLQYWQSVKKIQITHNCSQILENEFQILIANS
jgi:hypothetical protein